MTALLSVIVMSAMATAGAFNFLPSPASGRCTSTMPPQGSRFRPLSSPKNRQTPRPRNRSRFPHDNKKYNVVGILMANDKNNNNDNDINASAAAPGSNIDPGLKLLLCILIDLIGISSFAAPGVGEATDVAWAPISAVLVNYLFGNGVFTALAFAEELLPGFDIIPTATIAWFVENGNRVETTTTSASPAPPPQTPNPAQSESNGQSAPNEKAASKRQNISDAIDVEILD